jgi:hypothetical protein
LPYFLPATAAAPPEISEHPPSEVAYKPGEQVKLPCRANGGPDLQLVFIYFKLPQESFIAKSV